MRTLNKASLMILTLVLSLGVTSMAQAQSLDPQVAAGARCELAKSMPPELAAFRLLQSSKIITHETFGPLEVYMGALLPKAKVNLFGMTPTRWGIINRTGQPDAMIGVLYSADAPIANNDIVAAYQGGLKRQITLTALRGSALNAAEVTQAFVSQQPVKQTNYLLMALLKNGDRLVACAPLEQITRFVR